MFNTLRQARFLGYSPQDFSEIQFDTAGFLAILGEGSVLANAQVASLSRITFLPRLLPAPQALMLPSRPTKLEPSPGSTTGVESGNHREYINHVGHVLVDAEDAPEYSVRCVQVRRKRDADVQAKVLGPLWLVAILGFVESLMLFAFSIIRDDRPALLATLSLSLLSSLIGVSNKWTLDLPKRRALNGKTPPGNVVIRYAKGNFLVVQCTEDIARELYFAPENIKYMVPQSSEYRIISLVGTFVFMVGIISLSNASTPLQRSFAAAYMILNIGYWIVAALPPELHWDMSCFEVMDQCFDKDGDTEKSSSGWTPDFVEHNKTFTQALWKVIVVTKSTKWVKKSAAAPATPAWDEWLREARRQARSVGSRDEVFNGKIIKVWDMPAWDPQKALGELVQKHMNDPDSESE